MLDDPIDWHALDAEAFAIERFAAGETIFARDDDGVHMYVVRAGRVSIIASGVVLENLGPGGMFGEMAVIDGAPRSANAVAAEPTELALFDRPAFLALIRQNPEAALHVMHLLATRLRRMNDGL